MQKWETGVKITLEGCGGTFSNNSETRTLYAVKRNRTVELDRISKFRNTIQNFPGLVSGCRLYTAD